MGAVPPMMKRYTADPYYWSKQWLALRQAALRRDHYTCTVPGCRDKATHVDHIVTRKLGGADTLSNLRSLCRLHDHQLRERPNGNRPAKARLIGCGADGWPHARAAK